MQIFQRIAWTFTSPSRVFDDIREGRVKWWQPWLVVSVIYLGIGYLSLPVQRVLVELNPRGADPEMIDKQLEMMDRFGLIQLGATPVVMLFVGFLVAGLTYGLVSILAADSSFKKYFTLTWYASVVASVSQVLSVIIVRARGVDMIEGPADASVTASLKFLAPDPGVLNALLSTIELFAIWSLVLIGMGLMRIFGLSRTQAIVAVAPWVVIYIAMTLLQQLVGGAG